MNDTFVWDLNASNTVCLGAQLDRWNDVPVMTDKPSFFSKKKKLQYVVTSFSQVNLGRYVFISRHLPIV
jgi:hypothetical protein